MNDFVEDTRQLIIRAFRAAKESGKPDWQRMDIAVLKNRMLYFSDGKFKHGTDRFVDVLARFPDVVEVDRSGKRPQVRLLSEESAGDTSRVDVAGIRLRPDIWRALVGFRDTHVWDSERKEAVVAVDGDVRPRFPTLTEEELLSFRAEFVAAEGETADRAVSWSKTLVSDRELPSRLRNRWNGFLKRKLNDRLAQWATATGFELPSNVTTKARNVAENESGVLLDYIIERLREMTPDELRLVQLPASVTLRTRRR